MVPRTPNSFKRNSGRSGSEPIARAKSIRTAPDGGRPTKYHLAVIVSIALAASLLSVVNDYVYDDVQVILHDSRVTGGNWGAFFTGPYWQPPHVPDLYRPIASVVLGMEFAVGSGTPVVFRLVSCFLYALCALAVYRLAARVIGPRLAFPTSALFAAHPVHVEAVAQAVNQGELLVALACFSAAALYIDRRREARELRSRDWSLLYAIYAFAALTKENGLVLPGLLAACEFVIEDGGSPVSSRAKGLWKGYAGFALIGVVVLATRQLVLGSVVGAFTGEALKGLGLAGRMLTMLKVVPMWFRLFLWPIHLQVDYSPDEVVASTAFATPELAGLGLLVLAVTTAVQMRPRAPAVTFAIAWCGVALFPVSNIVPTSITLAERTLFLPSFGPMLALVALVGAVIREPAARRFRLNQIAAVGGVLLVGLGVWRSVQRETTWRNSARFWRTAAADAPKSKRIQAARRQAVLDIAREFEPAIVSGPNPAGTRDTLAYLLLVMNEDSAAVVQLRASLALKPAQYEPRVELVGALLAMGDYREAERWATEADSTSQEQASQLRMLAQLADSALHAGAVPGSVRVSTPYRRR